MTCPLDVCPCCLGLTGSGLDDAGPKSAWKKRGTEPQCGEFVGGSAREKAGIVAGVAFFLKV